MVNANTLSQLSELAKQLNAESDSVHAAIEQLNKQLRAMNLGVEAWIQIADSGFKLESQFETQRKYKDITLLGFCKIEDQWQLAINEQTVDYLPNADDRHEVDEFTEDSYIALLKAPRALRIAVVEHFDDLLDALKANAMRTLADAERAKKLAVPEKGLPVADHSPGTQTVQVIVEEERREPQTVYVNVETANDHYGEAPVERNEPGKPFSDPREVLKRPRRPR